MRLAMALSALLATSALAAGPATFPSKLIHGNGDSANRINILVMGEGWPQEQLDSGDYGRAADQLILEGLLKKEPYASYANLIQVHRIDVPSKDRGVGDQFLAPDTTQKQPGALNPTGSATATASSAGSVPIPTASPRAGSGTSTSEQVGSLIGGSIGGALGSAAGAALGKLIAGKGPSGEPESPLYAGETENTTETAPSPEGPTTAASPAASAPGSGAVAGAVVGAVGGQALANAPACPPTAGNLLPESRVKNTYFGVWRSASTTNGVKGPGDIVWFQNTACAVERMRNVNPTLKRHIVILVLNTSRGRGAAMFKGTSDFGYTCIPVHERRLETVSHEAGHCLVNLADEYTGAGSATDSKAPTVEPPEVNVTIESDPTKVKWRDWIAAKTPGIGVFEGGQYVTKGVWRPKDKCQMSEHKQDFCAICYEATLQRFYSAVSLVDGFTPKASAIDLTSGQGATFQVVTVGPKNGKIVGEWTLDGVPVRGTKTERATGPVFDLNLPARKLVAGQHEVKFVGLDKTPALLGANGSGSLQAPVAARRPNQRVWAVHVRSRDGQPRLTAVTPAE